MKTYFTLPISRSSDSIRFKGLAIAVLVMQRPSKSLRKFRSVYWKALSHFRLHSQHVQPRAMCCESTKRRWVLLIVQCSVCCVQVITPSCPSIGLPIPSRLLACPIVTLVCKQIMIPGAGKEISFDISVHNRTSKVFKKMGHLCVDSVRTFVCRIKKRKFSSIPLLAPPSF